MAGKEGERPQNKDAEHPPRALMGGERYERSEVHSGGTPLTETRLKNGVLQDISHLYTWLGEDGQKRWRTERQSIASFLADVRAGKERGDPRYKNIPENQIPTTIIHAPEIIYSSEEKPREGDNHWVHLSYITSSDQPEKQSSISILDSPVAESRKGAEPKRDHGREGKEREVFAAGREKNSFHEDAKPRRSETHSEDQSHQHRGEQRNRRSYGDANIAGAKDASSQEQDELAQARAVLQTIVNTPEDTIDASTPLDRIAGLNTEQVRQAVRTVAQQIINENDGGGFDIVSKRTLQGRLGMLFGRQHATSEERWEVSLYLNKNESDKLVMANTYALDQPREGMKHYYGFEDHRPGGKQANLGYLTLHSEKGGQRQIVEDIRIMWRGLRWMSANMLAWDSPNTIMPEELGSRSF